MLSYREVVTALTDLHIPADSPVLVHSDQERFGEIRGGSETLISALYTMAKRLMFPAFTTSTMVTPLVGPAENGMVYGGNLEGNLTAQKFHPNLQVDGSLGSLAEKFRLLPQSSRSSHPVLSFSAINLDPALQSQTLEDPLAPLAYLSQAKGWVLMIGVDQTYNTTLHYIEKLASRKQFIRWARTEDTIIECANMPGCPDGFNEATPVLQPISRKVTLNGCQVMAIPMNLMIHSIKSTLIEDPMALLCDRSDCESCAEIRAAHKTDFI